MHYDEQRYKQELKERLRKELDDLKKGLEERRKNEDVK